VCFETLIAWPSGRDFIEREFDFIIDGLPSKQAREKRSWWDFRRSAFIPNRGRQPPFEGERDQWKPSFVRKAKGTSGTLKSEHSLRRCIATVSHRVSAGSSWRIECCAPKTISTVSSREIHGTDVYLLPG
jgi:hypothetical protein